MHVSSQIEYRGPELTGKPEQNAVTAPGLNLNDPIAG